MSNEVNKKIMSILDEARTVAENAEKEYNDGAKNLEKITDNGINLFGGSAVTEVADIVTEARRLCDTLYAKYQTLVKIVDEQCKPLLESQPDAFALREIRNFIKWLNEESEIENNYAASLNSKNLGNLVAVRYFPSMENKTIQSFWESRYSMHPESKALEEKISENTKKEIEKREEKLKNNNLKTFEKMEKYHLDMIRREADIENIKQKRTTECNKLLEEEKEKLQNEYTNNYETALSAITNKIHANKSRYEEVSETLKNTGLFKMAEKKECKTKLRELEEELSSLEKERASAKATFDKQMSSVQNVLKSKEIQFVAECEKRFPLPANVKNAGEDPLYEIIRDILMIYGKQTIPELTERCLEFTDTDQDKVMVAVRRQLGLGVERTEYNRNAYFSFIDIPKEIKSIINLLKDKKKISYEDIMNRPQFKTYKAENVDDALCKLIKRKRIRRFEENGKVWFGII